MSIHRPARIDSTELFHQRHLFVDQRMNHGLCLIWQQAEKNEFSILKIRDIIRKEVDDTLFDYLYSQNFIELDKEQVRLTDSGRKITEDIIRRRRLAERLLEDVLDVSRYEVESQACEFEHIIDKNVEESICILLGHPRECPHGLSIPTGQCCIKVGRALESVVASLDNFKSGEKAKVAYILTRDRPHLHKLMSLGIVPGSIITIDQTYPTYVILVEETQLAIEKDIAQYIYLRRLH